MTRESSQAIIKEVAALLSKRAIDEVKDWRPPLGFGSPETQKLRGDAESQGEVYKENRNGFLLVSQPRIQNQTREIQHNTILTNNAIDYDDKLSRYESYSSIRKVKGPQKGSQQTD
ncbi:hypothetical protein AYI68_g6437 [Smittium mucronatum]|uniref:Uncharacterized protein n=1 Tax=Smittium mucronatum TaxID=133383 RepID=A0A1R0GRG7_9FUNG|nr:hypothetical protein AYI68_g6437 [Smittium mucronatum]